MILRHKITIIFWQSLLRASQITVGFLAFLFLLYIIQQLTGIDIFALIYQYMAIILSFTLILSAYLFVQHKNFRPVISKPRSNSMITNCFLVLLSILAIFFLFKQQISPSFSQPYLALGTIANIETIAALAILIEIIKCKILHPGVVWPTICACCINIIARPLAKKILPVLGFSFFYSMSIIAITSAVLLILYYQKSEFYRVKLVAYNLIGSKLIGCFIIPSTIASSVILQIKAQYSGPWHQQRIFLEEIANHQPMIEISMLLILSTLILALLVFISKFSLQNYSKIS